MDRALRQGDACPHLALPGCFLWHPRGGTRAVGAQELSVAALSFLSLSTRVGIAVPRFLFPGRRFIVSLDAIIAAIVVLMPELIQGSACPSQGALWDVADSRP